MSKQLRKQREIKPEFYALKLYLAKLSEKYKTRGYEKVFLENDNTYTQEVKELIKNLNLQNDLLDDIIHQMTKDIQKYSKLDSLPSKTKKMIMENKIMMFARFMEFVELTIRNEDLVVTSIDRFIDIEKKIDSKTKALTKYGFDIEFEAIFKGLKEKKHKNISSFIFDMNNLKTTNETYGHQTGSEAIFKFGNILRDILNEQGCRYILSNYFGGDEWFLVITDESLKDSINIIKKLFQRLNSGPCRIRDFDLNLSACCGLAHYHPTKMTNLDVYNPKFLLHIADTLVLQAKIQKNRNKSGSAYKAVNITHMSESEIYNYKTAVHTLPKKLKKDTLGKKNLLELFEIRKKQNDKILRARTLGVKKILKNNIELINEVISQKIIESIMTMMSETRMKTKEMLPEITRRLTHMVAGEVEKTSNTSLFTVDHKDEMTQKILLSNDYQKFAKKMIDEIYNENTLKNEFVKNMTLPK